MDQDLLHLVAEEKLLCMDQEILRLISGEAVVDHWLVGMLLWIKTFFTWLVGMLLWIKTFFTWLVGMLLWIKTFFTWLVGMLLYQDILHLVGWDVVVELQCLLVALDCYWILFATVPPVGYPHSRLSHLSPLRKKQKNLNTTPRYFFCPKMNN